MAPSESDWEYHKHLIQTLYCSSSLRELMEYMIFQRRKSTLPSLLYNTAPNLDNNRKTQYTSRLKNWGSRKYLSKEETDYAIHRKRKRDELGKETQIIWQGTVVAEKKLKRAESRSSLSDLQELDTGEFLRPSVRTRIGTNIFIPSSESQDSRWNGNYDPITYNRPRRSYSENSRTHARKCRITT